MENKNFFEVLDQESEVIVYKGQSEQEFQEFVTLNLAITKAKNDFLTGKLPADAFLDFLDHSGFDTFALFPSDAEC